MSRKQLDSATLIARDRAEAAAVAKAGNRVMPVLARGDMPASKQAVVPTTFGDARQGFNDPGSEHGPSIKCPDIYEALRKKGMSKEKAARISNSRC